MEGPHSLALPLQAEAVLQESCDGTLWMAAWGPPRWEGPGGGGTDPEAGRMAPLGGRGQVAESPREGHGFRSPATNPHEATLTPVTVLEGLVPGVRIALLGHV